MDNRCRNCRSEMTEKERKVIDHDTYIIFYCEKCKVQVVRGL
ncbi:MAG: hypothetical protein ABIJ34_02805 [archaeon]